MTDEVAVPAAEKEKDWDKDNCLMEIPIINIQPFVQESTVEEKTTVAKDIRTACVDFGFFYVTGHGIAEDKILRIRETADKFFKCSKEEKDKISIDKCDHARGYQTIGQNVTQYKHDWHEALDYYASVDEEHTIVKNGISVLSGKNPYPEIPVGFEDILMDYVQSMIKLGKSIMNAVAKSLGLNQDYFDKFMTDPFWVIRCIGYPPLPGDHQGISCGQHTDYGCLTILNTDDTKDALQVLSKQGEWITVNPIPGAFVINIGDMVNNWTNDLYTATLHRVIHRNTNYRISVPFFYVIWKNFNMTGTEFRCCY